jgi:hypothetical protein
MDIEGSFEATQPHVKKANEYYKMKSFLKGLLEVLVVGLVVYLTLTYGVQNCRPSAIMGRFQTWN